MAEQLDFSELIVHHLADHPVWTMGYMSAGGAGFAVTKHLVMMWVASAIVVGVVLAGAHGQGAFCRKLRSVLDALIVFIRQDIVEPALGHEGRAFLPYFMTLFLFILLMNLLGLVPFGSTATGNISVTAALSLTTLALIHLTGIYKHGFVRHFGNLIPHGVPWWVAPLVFAIELMGYLTKSLALCIRLFANMTAGHLVILLFLGLILLFGSSNPWAGLFLVAPVSVGLALGLYALELIVALIQAYVFTMLTAIFVGGAVHPDH